MNFNFGQNKHLPYRHVILIPSQCTTNRVLHYSADAEITYFNVSIRVNQDIRGLYVTMKDFHALHIL